MDATPAPPVPPSRSLWIARPSIDLLIGCAEERDARERGLPRLLLLPCLFLTFLFGPAGWLAYQGACYTRRPDTVREHTGLD